MTFCLTSAISKIEDIEGKSSAQLKVLILNPNGEVIVWKTFDNATKSLIINLALKKWKAAANHAFRHKELIKHTREAVRIAVASEFKALSKSDTIFKGRKPEEIAASNNKVFLHEIGVYYGTLVSKVHVEFIPKLAVKVRKLPSQPT